MLGAAHACANPLTARYDIPHGAALAILLPHVVRWNADVRAERYARLCPRRTPARRREALARRLRAIRQGRRPADDAVGGGHRRRTRSPALAALAAQQWTGGFNPRPFDAEGASRSTSAALLTPFCRSWGGAC